MNEIKGQNNHDLLSAISLLTKANKWFLQIFDQGKVGIKEINHNREVFYKCEFCKAMSMNMPGATELFHCFLRSEIPYNTIAKVIAHHGSCPYMNVRNIAGGQNPEWVLKETAEELQKALAFMVEWSAQRSLSVWHDLDAWGREEKFHGYKCDGCQNTIRVERGYNLKPLKHDFETAELNPHTFYHKENCPFQQARELLNNPDLLAEPLAAQNKVTFSFPETGRFVSMVDHLPAQFNGETICEIAGLHQVSICNWARLAGELSFSLQMGLDFGSDPFEENKSRA